jgi:hypothetical protein
MLEFVTQHQFWSAAVIYWIFSAAVSAMPKPASPCQARSSGPEPGPNTNPGYLWLYRFLHTIAGNITTAFGSRIPGVKALVILLLVPLTLSTAACAARYTVHPGAVNPADSAAYDTLLIAEAAIDQAREENQVHPLAPDVKEAFNTLVGSYNVAREAWLTYRGAIATNSPSDQYFQQLSKNLTDLINAIEALHERLRVQARREAQARQRAASRREAQARQRAASRREAQARQRAASREGAAINKTTKGVKQ